MAIETLHDLAEDWLLSRLSVIGNFSTEWRADMFELAEEVRSTINPLLKGYGAQEIHLYSCPYCDRPNIYAEERCLCYDTY